MAESSEGEEEGKLTVGNQVLMVEDDLREMSKNTAWSVSSWKSGNGVSYLCDNNLDTYWQSDGAQPHSVNIQFQKKVKLQLVDLYVDFKLDESYTPSKISIRAGDGFHNLKDIKTVELNKPRGWIHISLSGNDARETFVNTFMLQICVLSNHLNGRDTHVRQIKLYSRRPCFRLSFPCCFIVHDEELCLIFLILRTAGTLFHISHFSLLQGSSVPMLLSDEKRGTT